jgi:hypothetical protein
MIQPPNNPSDPLVEAYRAGVKACAEAYARGGPVVGIGVLRTPHGEEQAQAQAASKARPNDVPSDHLGSRLSSINDATQRAHLLANDAETIEMKLFGHAPNAGPNGFISPGQDTQIAGPLAGRFGDAARNLSAALDRLQTSLSRIGRHVE